MAAQDVQVVFAVVADLPFSGSANSGFRAASTVSPANCAGAPGYVWPSGT
jgi:hypothetical protein